VIAQCITESRSTQALLNFGMKKKIVVERLDNRMSANGGVLLVREADDKMQLTQRLTALIADMRDPLMITHKFETLWRQSIYQRACGYEDINDAAIARIDPAFMVAAGNQNPETGCELASTSTLQRFEYSVTNSELKLLQKLLPEVYLDTQLHHARTVKLASDTSCDPVHGDQQGAFYNSFYEERCYVPMFIWDQDTRFPLAAELRPGNAGPAEGADRILDRVVTAIRARHPEIHIEYTADAVYALPELFAFCERKDKKVTYFIGIKSNHALECKPEVKEACERAKREFIALYGEPRMPTKKEWKRKEERIRYSSKDEGRMQELAEQQDRRVRIFSECMYQAREWPAERRIVFRIEYTDDGLDVRYVVTNDPRKRSARDVYENSYCKRSRCENWVKEMKDLKCDRLSCQEFDANQFRLLLHTFAYALLVCLQQLLPDDSADISISSFVNKLLKVPVTVKESARQIKFIFSTWDPYAADFDYLLLRLQAS